MPVLVDGGGHFQGAVVALGLECVLLLCSLVPGPAAAFFSTGSYGLLVSTLGILSLNLSKNVVLLAEPGAEWNYCSETPPFVVDVDYVW